VTQEYIILWGVDHFSKLILEFGKRKELY
jgi:hypothetical protein